MSNILILNILKIFNTYQHVIIRNTLIITLNNVTYKYLNVKQKKIKKKPSSNDTWFFLITDDEGNTYQVYIDVDEVSKRTYIQKNELIALCNDESLPYVGAIIDLTQPYLKFTYIDNTFFIIYIIQYNIYFYKSKAEN